MLRVCSALILLLTIPITMYSFGIDNQAALIMLKLMFNGACICLAIFCWLKSNAVASRNKTNFYKKIIVDFETGSSAHYPALTSDSSTSKQSIIEINTAARYAQIKSALYSVVIITWVIVLYSAVIWISYLIYSACEPLGSLLQIFISVACGTTALYLAVYLIPEGITASHLTSRAIKKYTGPYIENDKLKGKHYTKVLKMRGFKGLGDRNWHHDPATPEQITILKRFGIVIDDALTKGEAAFVLEVLYDD